MGRAREQVPGVLSDMWNVELLIVDGSDRLRPGGREQLRDYFERHAIGPS